MSQDEFCRYVLSEGRRLYRDLPWRGIDDAYGVLVSEVMLQQTQVKRVLGRWERWMGMFPSPDALAARRPPMCWPNGRGSAITAAPLALKRAAEECSQRFGGRLPETVEQLRELPGIGPATAAGVTAFARNLPAIYIETNVRTVFIHTLFPDCETVSDKQLEPLVAACCPEAGQVRRWYYALLDVGADLKSQVGNASRRSAHYTRQSAFEGSRRQKRSMPGAHRAGMPGHRRRAGGGALGRRGARSRAGCGRPAAVRRHLRRPGAGRLLPPGGRAPVPIKNSGPQIPDT